MVNGTRQKGYIVTQPVNEPKSGLTVVIPSKDGRWKVGRILRPSVRFSMGMWMVEVNETDSLHYERSQEELFTLEFKYTIDSELLKAKLKYGQWQAAIDNDEVNKPKEVTAEITVGRFFNMAHILPSEKRTFTRAEAFEIFKAGYSIGRGEVFMDELMLKNHFLNVNVVKT